MVFYFVRLVLFSMHFVDQSSNYYVGATINYPPFSNRNSVDIYFYLYLSKLSASAPIYLILIYRFKKENISNKNFKKVDFPHGIDHYESHMKYYQNMINAYEWTVNIDIFVFFYIVFIFENKPLEIIYKKI